MTTQKNVYKNAYCRTNKASVANNISRNYIFGIQEFRCDLSLMTIR